jgi:molybdopterin molybdotransferase
MYPELIPVKEALNIIEDLKTKPKKEKITLEDANSRVLAQKVTVLIDVPPFDRAAMDGYAVIADDTKEASKSKPVYLDVVGEIGAGSIYQSVLKSGEALRIATGAPMPKGSDAVVMHEHVELSENKIKINSPLKFQKDVSLRGEDLKRGEVILKADQLLGPHHIALIASAGHKTVEVFKKPKIGIITTGSELVEPSKDLKPGKIINSNKYALKCLIEDTRAVPYLINCPDNIGTLLKELKDAVGRYDAVITTGGTAISKGDLVIDAVNSLGEVLIHGVSAKPGKPVGFGVVNKKPVFMLSGYPVAAAVQYDAFVRSYILKMQNIQKEFPLTEYVAGNDIRSSKEKHNIIRADLKEDKGIVYPIRTKAGINKSIVLSNCYIIAEEGVGEIKKGDKCKVLKYSSLKVC